ncbi:TonB-dependent receptor plug domain-containing protein [Kineobactrum salinum]|nr:TonB-dependent receptor [Kineobactrum salinum]
MKSQAILGALALISTLPAYSDSAGPLEEMVITSSRVPMPLREVGTSISVIDAAGIRARGFTSLQDVLRSQPSVAVSNNGGAGKVSSLRIRGEEAYRTLVLIDGIDISDTSAPQIGPRIEHLLSAGIQRVEILRGPQGMMYGADAGGVVNISTRVPVTGFGGDLSAEAGRYGSRQLSANVAAGNEQMDANLALTDLRSDGFNARSTDLDPGDRDGYDNRSAHGRVGWNPAERLRLELVARDVDGDNEFDSCFTNDTSSPTNRCSDSFDQRSWRGSAQYNGEQLRHELAYSHNRTERQQYSEGLPGFGTEGEIAHWSYLGSFAPSPQLQLVYGVDHKRETMDDGGFDTQRDQDGYYLEYQGSLADSLFFTAGARYDDNDDFGSHDTYRVSAAYLWPLAARELKLRGSWGTGFRAPSLYEIAYNRSSFAGPPAAGLELREERSEGYEVGLSWGDSELLLEAVYFRQSVKNEIFFDLDTFSGYLQGSGDSDSSGIELIADLPLAAQFRLQANYTYNDNETAAGGHRVYRPTHLGNLGLQWRSQSEQLRLGVQLRLARDAREADGTALDDYEVMDLNARFALLPDLELYGRVENLLNSRYQEIPTYRTSARAAYAGVRYSF